MWFLYEVVCIHGNISLQAFTWSNLSTFPDVNWHGKQITSERRTVRRGLGRLVEIFIPSKDGLYYQLDLCIVHPLCPQLENDCSYRELLKDDDSFYVPEVIDSLSTKRVLTTELVYGSSLDKGSDWNKTITNKVGIKTYMQALLSKYSAQIQLSRVEKFQNIFHIVSWVDLT